MAVRLYVGNLPFSISEAEVEEMFRQIGVVESTNLVTDRDNGRSRRFAFVEMDPRAGADSAEAADVVDSTVIGAGAVIVTECQRQPCGCGGSTLKISFDTAAFAFASYRLRMHEKYISPDSASAPRIRLSTLQ